MIEIIQTLTINSISEKEFLEMRTRWNSLLGGSITNEVFLLWEWVDAWWSSFKDNEKQLYILIGKNSNGELVGIAPLYRENNRIPGFGIRKIIKFCCSGDAYPDHLDFICERGYEKLFPKAALEYLKKKENEWDAIRLEGIKENSVVKNGLLDGPRDNHYIIECIPESKCPYLAIKSSFEEYLKSFSRKKRETLMRKRRKLLNKENVVYKTVDRKEDPRKHIEDLFSLHAGRANRKGIKTTFCGNHILNFHKKFIFSSLSENRIVISFLYEDSIPLVVYYCIRYNNKYYYYQSGISYEGENKSAGVVLLSLVIEKAFNEKCTEFDFLRGEEEYKYYWTKDFRYDYSIIIRKKGFGGSMASGAFTFIERLRTLKGYF